MIENLLSGLIISFIIQLIFFSFAAIFKTDKVTDLSYGLTFVTLVLFFFSKSSWQIPQILATVMITIWGMRLAGYLFVRILKTKKDIRFDKIRGDFGKFAQFWFFQAIAVWIIMLPTLVILATRGSTSFKPVTALGTLVWLVGFITEALADQQKFNFKSNLANKNRWIAHGLWKYSRHPNYFGEILCWWGIFLIASSYLEGLLWLVVVGPLFISYILLFVTGIPPLEKRYDQKFANNKEYQEYKGKTSLIIPLPSKK